MTTQESNGGKLFSAAKHQGITKVVVVVLAVAIVIVVVLSHLPHFLINRNLSENNFPIRESNLGPLAPQSGTLSTELQQHYYFIKGKSSITELRKPRASPGSSYLSVRKVKDRKNCVHLNSREEQLI